MYGYYINYVQYGILLSGTMAERINNFIYCSDIYSVVNLSNSWCYQIIIVPVTAIPVGLSLGMPPANNSAKPLGVRAAIELISPFFTVPLHFTGVFGESILLQIILERFT